MHSVNAHPASRRVVIVTPRFSPQVTIGGSETLMKRFAERLSGAGMDVTVLTTCAQDHVSWDNSVAPGSYQAGDYTVQFFAVNEDRNIPLFLGLQNRICAGETLSRSDQMGWIRNHVNSDDLCRHLDAIITSVDAVLVGPYLLGLSWHVAKICPEKTILVPCLHDEPFAYQSIFAEMFSSVAAINYNTAAEKQLAQRLFDPLHKITAIAGFGVALPDSDRNAFAIRHGIADPYLIYSGRREPMKGTDLLITLFEQYLRNTDRNIYLVLTGSGPVTIPENISSRVLDVGVLSEQEKQEAMSGALAFVHPSTYESLSIVLLEAFAAGIPALVNGGSEVLVNHVRDSGAGASFEDYDSFCCALDALLDSPAHASALGGNGRRYVQEHYRWDLVDKVLVYLVERVAA